MSNWQIGTIDLPGDLFWSDELTWISRKRAERVSLAGGNIIHRSIQTAGRPITLTTGRGVLVTRGQVDELMGFADDPQTDQFVVTHPDGRTFTCTFRHAGSPSPVDAAPIHPKDTPDAADPCTLTLRLMTA